MCLASNAEAAIAEEEPVAANTEEAALAAPVAPVTVPDINNANAVLVVDDAFHIVDQKMRSYLNHEKKRILKEITAADKILLNKHIKNLREYKIINSTLKKKLKNTLTNYRNDTKHLVSIFNDIFRDYLNTFIKSEEFIIYAKSIKKIKSSKNNIYNIYERLVGNDNRLMDLFNWSDIFNLLEMNEYDKVNDHYIPHFMTTNYFAHRFNLSSAFYDTTKNKNHVNKLFRDQLEPAEAEFLGEPVAVEAEAEAEAQFLVAEKELEDL
jgi:hypothetical protein